MNARLPLERTLTIANYLDFDPEPDLNTAPPPVGAPEGNYKGSFVNNTFRYVMAAIRNLGDAVPKLGPGMDASTTLGALATQDQVSANDLMTASVIATKIATGAVITTGLGDLAVTTAKIGPAAVTHAKIADGAVIEEKLGSTSVSSAKLQAMAVNTAALDNGAVTLAKIADGAVGAAKLTSGLQSSVAKAWVTFNAAGSIEASFNVSSVVKNATADYTINWDTNFASSAYAVLATASVDGTNLPRIAHVRSRAAGSARVIITTGSGTLGEAGLTSVHVVAFGEQ